MYIYIYIYIRRPLLARGHQAARRRLPCRNASKSIVPAVDCLLAWYPPCSKLYSSKLGAWYPPCSKV